MDKQIFDTIHKRIHYVWEEKIKEDYKNGWLLKEDTLKNALYHHLRTELSEFFTQHNLRIFTEFTDNVFTGTHKRPDMVVATADTKECLAVIEIKYKQANVIDPIYDDYDKLQFYVDQLNTNAHFYMATIWESFDRPTSWIRKNAAWAKDRVTELNASYINGTDYEPQFYVFEHK